MCEWRPDFDSLNERVTKIEGRMEQVAHDMGKMRSETQEGFKAGAAQMNAISAVNCTCITNSTNCLPLRNRASYAHTHGI